MRSSTSERAKPNAVERIWAQQRHHVGVPGRLMAAINRRIKLRGVGSGVEDVFDAHGDAGQQALAIVFRRIGANLPGVERNEGLNIRLLRLNAFNKGLGDSGSGHIAIDHRFTEGGGVKGRADHLANN